MNQEQVTGGIEDSAGDETVVDREIRAVGSLADQKSTRLQCQGLRIQIKDRRRGLRTKVKVPTVV